jgi:ribosomal protein S21
MVEVKRKKGESFESLFRKTKKRWKLYGLTQEYRKRQYRTKKKSKNSRKHAKVSAMQKHSKIEYLQKTGRLPVDPRNSRR